MRMELFRFQINAIPFSIFSRVNTRTNDMQCRCFARASRKVINIDNRILKRSLRGKWGFFLALENCRAEETSRKQRDFEHASVQKKALHYPATKELPCVSRGMISSVWTPCSLSRIFRGKYENIEKSAVRGSGAFEIKPLSRRLWSGWPGQVNQRNMVRPFQIFTIVNEARNAREKALPQKKEFRIVR